MPGEFLRYGWSMLGPFAGEEVGQVCGAGDAFAVGSAEVEYDREAVFAEAGMLFEGETVLDFCLCFR